MSEQTGHITINQALGKPIGTTQRPLIGLDDKPSVTDAGVATEHAITYGGGLPTIQSIVENVGAPVRSSSLSAAGAHFVMKLDPGSLVAIRWFLDATNNTDIGSQVYVVAVTEQKAGQVKSYSRAVLALVDLGSTGNSKPAAPGVPNSNFAAVDQIAVINDYTLRQSCDVVGEVTDGLAELMVDFVGNGWIELYGNVQKGSLGSNNSAGIWGQARIL